ncbi:hypothetical protein GQ600_27383 [Phytophthora cactorum]|nr:hypothetical protein GQ600_27383 [Phytophthora cactorum]
MLLWSRLSELEGLQRKLTKMEDLLVELVELQQDIAAFVGENLSKAVRTAMEGTVTAARGYPISHSVKQFVRGNEM